MGKAQFGNSNIGRGPEIAIVDTPLSLISVTFWLSEN
jgi:hypothetical protein